MTPLTYSTYRQQKYFASLDGLRCLSILAVILFHATSGYFPDDILIRQGFLGVHFFFVISGFLIVTLLLREKESAGEISLKKFYIRRTLRIFPIYYTVLLFYIIFVPVFKSSTATADFFHYLPSYLTYTSNWFNRTNTTVPFYIAWSLAVEEQFYALWPSFEAYLKKNWMPAAAMIFITIIVAVTQHGFLFAPGTENHPLYIFITSLSLGICCGVLLAHCLHNKNSFRIAAYFIGWKISGIVYVVMLLLAIHFLAPPLIICLLMAALIGSCVIRSDHFLTFFLNQPIIIEIGKVSYGMYLMHLIVLNCLQPILAKLGIASPWTLFIATSIFTFIAAWFSFNYYESFFLRLKEKFEPKRQ